MPRRVIDLLACWWSSDKVVWKMAPICIFWCLWWERNNRSFEDLKRTLEETLSLFYHTLYCWTSAYVHPLLFLFLTFSLAFLFLVRCFPCILPVYQGVPYAFLINLISYLSKKKKKGLSIAFRNRSSFQPIKTSIRIKFHRIFPFAFDDLFARRKRNKVPSVIMIPSFYFYFHGVPPTRIK
jgi:hypothetical protein